MNATVTYVLLLVFPGSNIKARLLNSAPPGSKAACHAAEWFQKESFTHWFKYFVRSVKLSKKDPVILMPYGHSAHSKNIEVIDCARENGVHIVCLPPHSTHCLQLLDVFFLQSLKIHYAREMEM
jgi:hypothetical protein